MVIKFCKILLHDSEMLCTVCVAVSCYLLWYIGSNAGLGSINTVIAIYEQG